MEKFGIENLKKIIAVPLEFGGIITENLTNEERGWAEWLKLVGVFDEIGGLFTVKWSMIKDEYMDLSDTEMVEIKEFMKAKFDLTADDIEFVIEDSFEIILDMERPIKKTIGMIKKVKILIENRKK